MHLDRAADRRKALQALPADLWRRGGPGKSGFRWWFVGLAAIACLLLAAIGSMLAATMQQRAAEEAAARNLEEIQLELDRFRSDVLRELPQLDNLDPQLDPNLDPELDRRKLEDLLRSEAVEDLRRDLVGPPEDSIRKLGEPAAEGGWGHLRGRFVVKGKVPELPKVEIRHDLAYCSKCDVQNESIVVGPNQELANVLVWLLDKPTGIHDDYKKTESAEVVLDHRKCRFEPHVCLLRTTQTLKILNSDPLAHNIQVASSSQAFNKLRPSGTATTEKLTRAERLPLPVSCAIHPWERSYLLVRDNPYMAVTHQDGAFELKNLPAGKLRFQAWHEVSGYLAVGDWKRGQFTCTIEPGKAQDLGTVEVPAELLKFDR
jgi:hypothetical protein